MRHAPRLMPATTLAPYPEAAAVEDGRLLIGGFDAGALAPAGGTPAHVVAGGGLLAPARGLPAAPRPHHHRPPPGVLSPPSLPPSPPPCPPPPPPPGGSFSPQRPPPAPPCCACSRRRVWAATWPPAGSCTSRFGPASRPSASTSTATRSPRRSCAWPSTPESAGSC